MIPVYAHGLFTVCKDGTVLQHIIFNYVDPSKKYKQIINDPERLEEELRIISKNMQNFLDSEEVLINGVRTYPKVRSVWVGLSGSADRPYIELLITFKGELKPGINIYEDKYEPDIAEYDYAVTWVFPEDSRIIEVDVGFDYVMNGNVLRFSVPEGSETPGYEKISFYLESL